MLRCIACHPLLRDVAAFGTADGRVGLYDLSAADVVHACTARRGAVRVRLMGASVDDDKLCACECRQCARSSGACCRAARASGTAMRRRNAVAINGGRGRSNIVNDDADHDANAASGGGDDDDDRHVDFELWSVDDDGACTRHDACSAAAAAAATATLAPTAAAAAVECTRVALGGDDDVTCASWCGGGVLLACGRRCVSVDATCTMWPNVRIVVARHRSSGAVELVRCDSRADAASTVCTAAPPLSATVTALTAASSARDAVTCVRWCDGGDDERARKRRRRAADAPLLGVGYASGALAVFVADAVARALQLVSVLRAHSGASSPRDAKRCAHNASVCWCVAQRAYSRSAGAHAAACCFLVRPIIPPRLVGGVRVSGCALNSSLRRRRVIAADTRCTGAQVFNVQSAIDAHAPRAANADRGGDVDDGASACVATFAAHSGRVLCVAWSAADGDLAFSGSDDQVFCALMCVCL